MTLQRIQETDIIPVENVNILLYGTPGIGKTSIACSSERPILCDFDRGAHRSEFRSEAWRFDTWQDFAMLGEKELGPYKTIILDTTGRALDLLTQHLFIENPKFKTASGTLTLQGWGALKATFGAKMAQLRLLGKDILMLAHDKETSKDEITGFRADIQGGTYAEIFKLADSVAYFGAGGEKNRGLLDFDPKPEHSGKNPGQIEVIHVPNLHQEPHFMEGVIGHIKGKLGEIGERGRAIVAAVDEHRDEVEGAKTLKKINELAKTSNDIKDLAVQAQVKHLIMNKAKSLGLRYDKQKHAFVKEATEDKGESK